MIQAFTLILLATLSAMLAVIGVPFQWPGVGQDPFWPQALVEATDQGWIFGRDLVFTYGPLHQLGTQQLSAHLLPLLLGRLIYGAAWAAASGLLGLLAGWAPALALVVVLASIPSGADTLFFLLCALGVLLAMAPLRPAAKSRQGRSWPLAHQGLLAVHATGIAIGMLIKLSYIGAAAPALAAISVLSGMQALRSSSRRAWLGSALVIALPLLGVILIWCALVSTDPSTLLFYVLGPNRDIVAGYSDAMSYGPATDTSLITGYLFACLTSALLLHTWLQPPHNTNNKTARQEYSRCSNAITALALSAIGWAAFKASFVRDDDPHTAIGGFSALGFLIILAIWNTREHWTSWRQLSRRASLSAALVLAMTYFYAAKYKLAAGMSPGLFQQTWDVASLALNPSKRQQLSGHRAQALQLASKSTEDYGIPAGATADIISVNITTLLSNNLHYQPRPVPQSYSAYTERLQKLNADHFSNDKTRPEYVIVNLVEIDGRLPITLDSAALRQIQKHYIFSHRGSRGALIFRRHATTQAEQKTSRDHAANPAPVSWGELTWQPRGDGLYQSNAIMIPRSLERTYLNVSFKDSISRALLSILHRPLPVRIEYLDADGRVMHHFRLIPKAGLDMLIWPLITSNNDFYRMVVKANPKATTPPGTDSHRPVAIRFVAGNPGSPFRSSRYLLHP